MAEEWLSSRMKLCQLTIEPKTDSSNFQDLVVNTQSHPQPDYNQASIISTLEAYRSDLKTGCRDQNLEPKSAQKGIIQHFAEMLSGEILDATVKKRKTPLCPEKTAAEVTEWTIRNQAMRLSCEIYNRALVLPKQTLGKDGVSDLHSESCTSSMYFYNQEELAMDVDPKMEHNKGTNNHVVQPDVATYSNTLNEMSNMGSLDYPDAPPSTPLLPEMIRSRASFSRKLKGGLAKEFLPSPPPPTPKDQQAEPLSECMSETNAEKSEFMVRLMRSLSLACSQHEDLEEEPKDIRIEKESGLPNGISTLSDYASQLSADIITCITTAQPSIDINRETPARGVQLLAKRLAEEIIIMSAAEVMGSNWHDRKSEQNSHMSTSDDKMASSTEASLKKTSQAQADTLLPRSSLDGPYMDSLTALAGRLIANTLVQAFSEVERGALQHSTNQQFPGRSMSSKVQDHDLSLNNTNSQTTPNHCNSNSVDTYIMLDSSAETSTSERLFAEKMAHEVLECSIQEASSSLLSCNQLIVDTNGFNSSVASEQTVLRGFICDKLSQDIRELQCVLLWAASSHTGASVLQIDVSDNCIQQQLGSLVLKARVHGWTVGDLLTLLLQYCEDPETASRGRQSDRSLLGHLLLCVG